MMCRDTRCTIVRANLNEKWEDRIGWRGGGNAEPRMVGKRDIKRMREYVKWNICHVRGRCIVRIRAWTTEISWGRSWKAWPHPPCVRLHLTIHAFVPLSCYSHTNKQTFQLLGQINNNNYSLAKKFARLLFREFCHVHAVYVGIAKFTFNEIT